MSSVFSLIRGRKNTNKVGSSSSLTGALGELKNLFRSNLSLSSRTPESQPRTSNSSSPKHASKDNNDHDVCDRADDDCDHNGDTFANNDEILRFGGCDYFIPDRLSNYDYDLFHENLSPDTKNDGSVAGSSFCTPASEDSNSEHLFANALSSSSSSIDLSVMPSLGKVEKHFEKLIVGETIIPHVYTGIMCICIVHVIILLERPWHPGERPPGHAEAVSRLQI